MGGPGSGRASKPEHFKAKSDAGIKSNRLRKERKQAAHKAVLERAGYEDQIDARDLPLEADIAVDEKGGVLPMPSRDLAMYPDGEAERQLAWGRYIAGRQRAVELKARERLLFHADAVGAWCERVMAEINVRLPQLYGLPDALPGASEEQRKWLLEKITAWDNAYREHLSTHKIE